MSRVPWTWAMPPAGGGSDSSSLTTTSHPSLTGHLAPVCYHGHRKWLPPPPCRWSPCPCTVISAARMTSGLGAVSGHVMGVRGAPGRHRWWRAAMGRCGWESGAVRRAVQEQLLHLHPLRHRSTTSTLSPACYSRLETCQLIPKRVRDVGGAGRAEASGQVVGCRALADAPAWQEEAISGVRRHIAGVGRRGHAGERLSRAATGPERAGDVRGGVGGGRARRGDFGGGVRAGRSAARACKQRARERETLSRISGADFGYFL